jgi:hypothetical protein
MAAGGRRFARQHLDRARDLIPELPQAKVTAIATGAGADGLDVVTVSYLGASIKCSHEASYTPVVGHMVAIYRYAGGYCISGRPVGFPTAP